MIQDGTHVRITDALSERPDSELRVGLTGIAVSVESRSHGEITEADIQAAMDDAVANGQEAWGYVSGDRPMFLVADGADFLDVITGQDALPVIERELEPTDEVRTRDEVEHAYLENHPDERREQAGISDEEWAEQEAQRHQEPVTA